MQKWSLHWEGGKDLARAIRALPAELQEKAIVASLKDAAEPIRRRMEDLAPREPGKPDIADWIVISVASRIGDVGGGRWEAKHDQEWAVAIGPAKAFFYGLFLEYGTRRAGARPFMRPAFDTEHPKSLSILASSLWRLIVSGLGRAA
jgi:HK97 gp10 family phage protein